MDDLGLERCQLVGQHPDGESVVGLVDDRYVDAGLLQPADAAAMGQRHDSYVVTLPIEAGHERVDVLLSPSVRAGCQNFDHAHPAPVGRAPIDLILARLQFLGAHLEDLRGGCGSLSANGRPLYQQPCCTLHEEYLIPADAQIVGVVARLEAEKGHRTLLEAWPLVLAEVPSARLLIIGEGSERDSLEAQVVSLGIEDRVVFTGRREDVPAVTAALDVAVLPSYREAQGLSVLEAMALGRPVIASRVGGIPEMIEDGVSGLLVEPHDCDALAAGIVRLLTDHPLADMIAHRGHELVHDRFCIELMVHSISDLYDQAALELRASEGVAS